MKREGGAITLIYKRKYGALTKVQQSKDLKTWTTINTIDVVLAKTNTTQTIKSIVPITPSKQLFFRVPVTLYRRVTLAWDRSADPNIVGYLIYYGPGSKQYNREVDVGNRTSVILSLPEDGKVYFVSVTGYNHAGLITLPSNEIACP